MSLVCIAVGTIHFLASGGKADFVLVALIVICFGPWLGQVFESIGKEGAKFRGIEQGADTDLKSRQGSSETASTSETVDGTRRPDALRITGDEAQVVVVPLPSFDSLSPDAKKNLATLWKYQQKFFPASVSGRWTFSVKQTGIEQVHFASGVVVLERYGLAGRAANGQLALTDMGLEYCKSYAAEIEKWPFTYDSFDN